MSVIKNRENISLTGRQLQLTYSPECDTCDDIDIKESLDASVLQYFLVEYHHLTMDIGAHMQIPDRLGGYVLNK